MKHPCLWSNIALLFGVAIIVAPVAIAQGPINPYVLTAAKIATALGYTPANGSLYCALTGCTMTGTFVAADGGNWSSTRLTVGGAGVQIPNTGFYAWNGRAGMYSTADGVILLQNNASTSFTALLAGGTTSSFPSWRVSGTTWQAKLADNSGDSPVTAASISTSSTAFMHITTASLANGAASGVGTLTNAPNAGNPTKFIPINDNGTTRYIPAW